MRIRVIFDTLTGRRPAELSPRDQARLRLASELAPRQPPPYEPPPATPWYDKAVERMRRDG
jgi:hypothetical protein